MLEFFILQKSTIQIIQKINFKNLVSRQPILYYGLTINHFREESFLRNSQWKKLTYEKQR